MQKLSGKLAGIFLGLVLALGVSAEEEPALKLATGIKVSGAYINIPVPGTQSTAAFFILANASDKDVALTAVQSDLARRIELHSHVHENGMMKMRKLKLVNIPAKSSIAFASGSYHVMLFDLQRAIQTGEKVNLTLEFSDGSQLATQAQVKSLFDSKHHD
jgi:copper(I)-binding protein